MKHNQGRDCDRCRMTPAARNRLRIRRLCEGAVIAALYFALTWLSNIVGLASGAIQVRISEALCVLGFFTPAAIPGLWIGCMLANLTMSAAIWDVVFGSLATLIGAVGAYLFGVAARRAAADGHKKLTRVWKILIPLPTVVANAVIVPLVLRYAYGIPDAMWFLVLTVGVGEIISAWVLGLVLLAPLERTRRIFD